MWLIAAFGVVIMAGGIVGYLQSQSLISLITGSLFGLALLASAFAITRGVRVAHYVALLLAATLTAFFHWRFVKTEVFLPSGLLAIISCFVSVALLVFRPRKKA